MLHPPEINTLELWHTIAADGTDQLNRMTNQSLQVCGYGESYGAFTPALTARSYNAASQADERWELHASAMRGAWLGGALIRHHYHIYPSIARTFDERPTEAGIELLCARSVEIKP